MHEKHDIFLRAHTEKVVENPRTQRKKEKKLPERLPPFALFVDTETRTDVHQRLMFGHFRVCKLVNGPYLRPGYHTPTVQKFASKLRTHALPLSNEGVQDFERMNGSILEGF